MGFEQVCQRGKKKGVFFCEFATPDYMCTYTVWKCYHTSNSCWETHYSVFVCVCVWGGGGGGGGLCIHVYACVCIYAWVQECACVCVCVCVWLYVRLCACIKQTQTKLISTYPGSIQMHCILIMSVIFINNIWDLELTELEEDIAQLAVDQHQ